MCGIFGRFSLDKPLDGTYLRQQRDTLFHRGPDSCGEWYSANSRVYLAHRRLAIIDLSENAAQPMKSHDGRYQIIFNGEIYNFKELRTELEACGHIFRTESDTEVILHSIDEWGFDCLQRFSGMFALAVYDSSEDLIFLARDRAGEKPLFYSFADGILSFASELKALVHDPAFNREISEQALDCFLGFGYIPGDLCIFREANKLPPAHAMIVSKSGLRIWKYWQLPKYDETSPLIEEEAINEFNRILDNSVRQQLIADVPVGVLLSGGLDSSLVTAMAVRHCSKVKTFTVRFPGYGHLDETEHARLIAGHFATEHIELDAGETGVDLLPLLAQQFDEPMVDSSMIPTYLVSKMVRQHCTVALGGDGGDELFGGYAQYCHFSKMNRYLNCLPKSLRKIAGRLSEIVFPVGMKGRNWFRMAGIDFAYEVPVIGSLFEADKRNKLLGRSNSGAAEKIWTARTPVEPDIIQRYTRMDFENYLPEDILVKVDRAAMMSSLEMRAPFLDHRLIEFAFSRIPSDQKADCNSKKIFLKKAAKAILPAEFDFSRKQGFSIPLQKWLKKAEWQTLVTDTLLASDCMFDKKICRQLLADKLPAVSNSERVFALVMFELWRKRYKAPAA